MARLNRSTLSCIGLLVSLGTASVSGCGFETRGTTPSGPTTGASGGAGGDGGMATTGGMGGEGGGQFCKPDTTQSCYSGMVATANVGICKTGTQTCLADGTAYDDCMGEVTPGVENCVMPGDEDCDGYSDLEDSECKCTVPNMKAPCITGMPGVCTMGTGVCSADGRSVDTCTPVKPASPLENCATPDDEDCDGVVGPACSGTPVWTYAPVGSSADPADDAIFSVAITPNGESVIGGVVDGMLGGDGFGVMAGKGYVAKLDANMGMMWEVKFENATFAVARGVAIDKDGNVLVAGTFSGTLKIGMDTLVSNSTDIFLVKYDPAGTLVWVRSIISTRKQEVLGLAVDGNGNINITGATEDPVDFGGGSPLPVTGTDFFMASYAADKTYRWSKIYPSAGTQIGRSITTTATGDVVVIGDSDNDTNLGSGTAIKGGGNKDFFVARYTNNDGSYVWGKLFGTGGDQVGRNIAIETDQNIERILITGGFAEIVDWGGGQMMTAIGSSDVYVAKLDGQTGDHVAHAQGGKSGTSVGNSIAADASGNVTVFGHFTGTIDFGGQEVASTVMGENDTFLVKLKVDDWKPVWTKPYGKDGHQYGWDVAAANDAKALVGGTFYTELEVPPATTKPSTRGADLFAVFVNP